MTPHCGVISEITILKEGVICTHHHRRGSEYLCRTTSKFVFLVR
jgi:hypothetical protein